MDLSKRISTRSWANKIANYTEISMAMAAAAAAVSIYFENVYTIYFVLYVVFNSIVMQLFEFHFFCSGTVGENERAHSHIHTEWKAVSVHIYCHLWLESCPIGIFALIITCNEMHTLAAIAKTLSNFIGLAALSFGFCLPFATFVYIVNGDAERQWKEPYHTTPTIRQQQ